MSIKGEGGGVRRLMKKSILNFHFDYLNPSLVLSLDSSNLDQWYQRLSQPKKWTASSQLQKVHKF